MKMDGRMIFRATKAGVSYVLSMFAVTPPVKTERVVNVPGSEVDVR